MTLRVLIVDDEPLARRRVRGLLAGARDVEVVGECAGGRAAVAAIREAAPDVVFLDVQMPELDGFGVLAEVGAARAPAVVFVTAHDEHALRAFEVHALDYLLKPFRRERFEEALRRARAAAARGAPDARLAALLEDRERARRRAERLLVRDGGRVTFVRVASIDWLEAAGNYVKLHAGGAEHLVRETLTALEARLDPERFARIHRSLIVNLDRVAEVLPGRNDGVVVLAGGTRLPLSRSYRDRLVGG